MENFQINFNNPLECEAVLNYIEKEHGISTIDISPKVKGYIVVRSTDISYHEKPLRSITKLEIDLDKHTPNNFILDLEEMERVVLDSNNSSLEDAVKVKLLGKYKNSYLIYGPSYKGSEYNSIRFVDKVFDLDEITNVTIKQLKEFYSEIKGIDSNLIKVIEDE